MIHHLISRLVSPPLGWALDALIWLAEHENSDRYTSRGTVAHLMPRRELRGFIPHNMDAWRQSGIRIPLEPPPNVRRKAAASARVAPAFRPPASDVAYPIRIARVRPGEWRETAHAPLMEGRGILDLYWRLGLREALPPGTEYFSTVVDDRIEFVARTGALTTRRTLHRWQLAVSVRVAAAMIEREAIRTAVVHWFALAHDRGGYS